MDCCCNGTADKTRIVYSCSGCCDAGKVSDLLGRRLRKEGYAQSTCSCLASISAGVQTYIDKTKAAGEVICIDGCKLACARKTIEKINVKPKSYILTEMGFENGKMEISEELILNLYNRIAEANS